MSLTLARHQRDVRATMRLAAPLAVAQLAHMAMGVTDTVLLGGLGPDALAGGGLGGMIYITLSILLQGMLTAVSILMAQARGAGDDSALPRIYWAGMVLTILLMLPAFALFSVAEPLLLALGEPAALARDAGAYLGVLRWGIAGSLIGTGLMRAVLPAIGRGGLLTWVSLAGAVVNGVLCWGLIHGAWMLPALGMLGAALATVLVVTGEAVVLLALLHGRGPVRRFVVWRRPRRVELASLLRLGIPISATFAVETLLFMAVSLMMGLFGQETLAAHQIAMSVLSVAFMIPLGIAQAANVRVGNAVGARNRLAARRAGLVAIGLGAAVELASALFVVLLPQTVVGWFVSPDQAGVTTVAVAMLRVAAVFQVADGVQSVAAGALRGLGDTRVPFALAAAAYWGVGFPAAWGLAVTLGYGAVGAWWGLAASLMTVAALLTGRFYAATGVRSPAWIAAGRRLERGASGHT